MTVEVIIRNTPINVPVSGDSPNWAPAITQAIQELADAVNSVGSAYDVPLQSLRIDEYPSASNIQIDNLYFPSTHVLSAQIYYAVKRNTSTESSNIGQNVTEEGILEILYNIDNPTLNKWEIVRTFTGDANISFSISDLGQVKFSTTLLSSGIDHKGTISFRALSILNS
jgi:hypothetical protein